MVPIGVEEDHDDDVNELDILGFTDDDVEFQVLMLLKFNVLY
jgi:hypothetical protein